MQYLAAPVLYVGITQAGLCDRLRAEAGGVRSEPIAGGRLDNHAGGLSRSMRPLRDFTRWRLDVAAWIVHHEQLLYDTRGFRDGPQSGNTGVDEIASLQFGFPTAICLQDGTFLETHWCVEQGVSGIRWTKFRIEWNP
jgi:hypothetical protein